METSDCIDGADALELLANRGQSGAWSDEEVNALVALTERFAEIDPFVLYKTLKAAGCEAGQLTDEVLFYLASGIDTDSKATVIIRDLGLDQDWRGDLTPVVALLVFKKGPHSLGRYISKMAKVVNPSCAGALVEVAYLGKVPGVSFADALAETDVRGDIACLILEEASRVDFTEEVARFLTQKAWTSSPWWRARRPRHALGPWQAWTS